MYLGLSLWIGFVLFIFIIVLVHYFYFPVLTLNEEGENNINKESYAFQKTYFTLKGLGYTPYSHVHFGSETIDIALIDYKIAISFYSPEDLLQPSKRKKLNKQKRLLDRNGWFVIQVREKELQSNFRPVINQIKGFIQQKTISW